MRAGYSLDANVRTVLHDMGIDPNDVLRKAQLPEDLFQRRGQRLSSAECYRFWEALEALSDAPAIPIALTGTLTTESFSPPIFAALCSPDFVTAVGRISRFKPLIAPIDLGVDAGPIDLRLTLTWWRSEPEPPPSLVLTELAFFVALARIGTRKRILPIRVITPDVHLITPEYNGIFGTEVQHGPVATIVFSMQDAARPFLTANESMWDTFAPELRRRLADLDSTATVSERVAAVLIEHLPSGRASMEAVAKKLLISKRTLQRKLNAEGTSFQEILKRVRSDLAIHYLTNSHLTATEISYLIGFEDANSFFRAFGEWTGKRRACRGSDDTDIGRRGEVNRRRSAGRRHSES